MMLDKTTYNYNELFGKIKNFGITQKDLAQVINISPASLNLKLNNRAMFKQQEISAICDALDIPINDVDRYFFTKKL
jgi:DNA-binding Xre family transcriptional regulator